MRRANIRATIAQGLEEGWNAAQVRKSPLPTTRSRRYEPTRSHLPRQRMPKKKASSRFSQRPVHWLLPGVILTDAQFVKQTLLPSGAVEIGPFPSGAHIAPAHPHCRCSKPACGGECPEMVDIFALLTIRMPKETKASRFRLLSDQPNKARVPCSTSTRRRYTSRPTSSASRMPPTEKVYAVMSHAQPGYGGIIGRILLAGA